MFFASKKKKESRQEPPIIPPNYQASINVVPMKVQQEITSFKIKKEILILLRYQPNLVDQPNLVEEIRPILLHLIRLILYMQADLEEMKGFLLEEAPQQVHVKFFENNVQRIHTPNRVISTC